jgi:hypothetical protein
MILLLGACATTSHVVTGTPRTPIEPSQVKVYSNAPPNYEEIAVIDATSRSSFSFGDQKKMNAVIERLKKEAASLGANGVLLQSTGSEYGGRRRHGGKHRGWRGRHLDRHRNFYRERQQDWTRPGDLRPTGNAIAVLLLLKSGTLFARNIDRQTSAVGEEHEFSVSSVRNSCGSVLRRLCPGTRSWRSRRQFPAA